MTSGQAIRTSDRSRAPSGAAVTRALKAAPFEAFGDADPHGRPELRERTRRIPRPRPRSSSQAVQHHRVHRAGRRTEPGRPCPCRRWGGRRRRRGIRSSHPKGITRQSRTTLPPNHSGRARRRRRGSRRRGRRGRRVADTVTSVPTRGLSALRPPRGGHRLGTPNRRSSSKTTTTGSSATTAARWVRCTASIPNTSSTWAP